MNSSSVYSRPVKIMNAVFMDDNLVISDDFTAKTVPLASISHLCSAIIKKGSIKVYYLFFYEEETNQPYFIESDSFNFKKFLDKTFNKQEKNFLELLKIISEKSKRAFIDWPLRDVLVSDSLVNLPVLNDMAHLISYSQDVKTNNKFEVASAGFETQSQEDSPYAIFIHKLEAFRSRRNNARNIMNKARDLMSKNDGNHLDQTYLFKALAEIDRALAVDFTFLQANFLKAEICVKLQKYREAADALNHILLCRQEGSVKAFSSSNIYLNLASYLNIIGDYEAEKDILILFYGLFPSKNYDVEDIAKICKIDSHEDNWYIYYVYGHDLLLKNEFTGAIEMFNQSISRCNSFRWSYHGRACCFKEIGRWSQAIDSFNIANRNSESLLTYMELAQIQEEQGRFDLAQDYYRHAIRLRPLTPLAYMGLAINLFEYSQDESSSFDMLLKAADLDPYGDFIDDAIEIINNMSQRIIERKGKDISERDDLKVGDILENRYKVREIYKGGMGIVYIVRDNENMNLYALKTFQDKFLWNESIIKMFNKEAEVWIRLGMHNNIVQAVKLKSFDGKPYLFLEYIDGTDLEEVLKYDKLYIPQVIDYSMQFCNGMAYAYRTLGIIHQDIKPSNCMITKQGVLKITDFGLVKIFSDASSGEEATVASPTAIEDLTKDSLPPGTSVLSGFRSRASTTSRSSKITAKSSSRSLGKNLKSTNKTPSDPSTQNQIVGTLPYMAPEQFTAEWPVSTATDIYSFGAMLYEMLTGTPPFGKDDPEKCIIGHIEEEPAAPVELRNDIPATLSQVVMRCLKKDPSERYEDFGEVMNALNMIYEEIFHSSYTFGSSLETDEENTSLESLLFKGEAFMVLSKYKEAITTLGEALKLYPTSPALICSLAECFRRIGKNEEAFKYLHHALTLDPKNSDAYYKLGLIYFSQKDLKKAHESFAKAAELNPNDAEIWLKLGAVYDIVNNTDEALRNYDLALKVNPRNSIAWNNKGFIFQRINRYADAMECYIRAIEFNPRYHVGWFNQGTLQQILNLNEESIESFTKVLELNPHNTKASIGIAIAYQKLRKFEQALKIFDDLIKKDPQNVSLFSLKADCLYRGGLKEMAAVTLNKALKNNPANVNFLEHLSIILSEIYDFENAYLYSKKALQIKPDKKSLISFNDKVKKQWENLKFFEQNLSVYFSDKLPSIRSSEIVIIKDLIDKHRELLKEFPGNGVLLARLSLLLSAASFTSEGEKLAFQIKSFTNAVLPDLAKIATIRKTLDKMLLKTPKKSTVQKESRFAAIMNTGKIFLESGQYTKALLSFQKIIAEDWRNVDVWFYSLLCKYNIDLFDEVTDLKNQGLARNPLDARLWLIQGLVFRKMNQFEEALNIFHLILAIDPTCSSAFLEILNLYEMYGATHKKREYANLYLSFYRKFALSHPETIWIISLILVTQSRHVEARLVLKKMLEVMPDSIDARFASVYIDIDLEEFTEARNQLLALKNSILKNDKDIELAVTILGYVSFKLEKYRETAALLSKIPFTSDYYSYAMYYLTAALTKAENKTKRAENITIDYKPIDGRYFIANLLDKYPNDYLLWEAQGGFQSEIKQYDDALWSFTKSLELNPFSEVSLLNKGIVLMHLGKEGEAEQSFDKALEINPRNFRALIMKALILYYSRSYAHALELCDKIMELYPQADQLLHFKTLILYKEHKTQESLEAVDAALAHEPFNSDIWNTRGIIMRKLERLSEEIFSYNRALSLNPKNPYAAMNKAIWLMEMQNYQQAIDAFDIVIQGEGDVGIAWREKGRCQQELGRYKEALRCYNSSIQLLPNDSESYNGKAETLVSLKRYDEALFLLDKSLEINVRQSFIWNNRGVVLYELGRHDEANNSFLKAYRQEEVFDFVIFNILLLSLETQRNEQVSIFGQKFIDLGSNLPYPSPDKSALISCSYRKKISPFSLSNLKENFEIIIEKIPFFNRNDY